MAKVKKEKAEIVVVLDRSGSMVSIKEDMVGGFKHFLDEQKKVDAPCVVSLYQFDDEFETVYEGVKLSKITGLDMEPRGSTALLDAVGRSVALVKERHKAMTAAARPDKVIFVVITDGCENSSTEWTKEKVSELVKSQQSGACDHCGHDNEDGWQFLFLGANVDSFATASDYGFSVASTANFNATKQGVGDLYRGVAGSVSRYRSGATRSASLNTDSDGTILSDES